MPELSFPARRATAMSEPVFESVPEPECVPTEPPNNFYLFIILYNKIA